MYPKLAIAAVLALAAGSPTHCFAKESPVVFHDRPFYAYERQGVLEIEKAWSRLNCRRQPRRTLECVPLVGCGDYPSSARFFFDRASTVLTK